jgi:hypothetical protein
VPRDTYSGWDGSPYLHPQTRVAASLREWSHPSTFFLASFFFFFFFLGIHNIMILVIYHLFQKLKLIRIGKFNHLINNLTFLSRVGSNSILIGDVQHIKYLIKMRDK